MAEDIQVMIQTRAGRRFAQMAAGMPAVAREVQIGLADDSELLMQAAALKGVSTRMAREIRAVSTSPGVIEVQSNARNPQTGFAYTGVTRFGHRKMWIEPKARNRASTISTRKSRGRGKRANLRVVFASGEVIFRRRVKGFKPTHDWVQDAMPEIKVTARRAAVTLGRRLVTRYL